MGCVGLEERRLVISSGEKEEEDKLVVPVAVQSSASFLSANWIV